MRSIQLAVLSALVVLLGFTAACSSAPTAGLQQVLQRGTVRVCSTGDYRPFTHRDADGNWSGLDIEMAHDMATRLGVRLDLVQRTWANLVGDLDGKCDVAMGGCLAVAV
jgi:cyclohexadienyl dehydratase